MKNIKLWLEMSKAVSGLIGSVIAFVLLIVSIVEATRGQYPKATYDLALVILLMLWK